MTKQELEVLRVLLMKRIQPRDAEEGVAIAMMFDKVAALANAAAAAAEKVAKVAPVEPAPL